ncbi:radical SAM protein with 4Fe4S-binding SPASM domain [Ruminiclostridium sufflavum DSM 19573]|uniref:Radical SAM protein with 4Fe4S-binding SPASM domain n=1 Tax=Ruminiclostridium sufflavum DSM 19573 TaxID=1121337 RepID=A0A318Y7B9_9FIRM|nr:radical SAM protein [Ruminiclostridium sufflavum]PYG88021.1 radical SAM protein with 4Fe4S-binding SPASM domain [Ruminiclostridium sufflavum DSM 19573]
MYITKYFLEHKLPSGRLLLVNTLVGKINFVSKELVFSLNELKDGNIANVPTEHILFLKQNGYAFESQTEETLLLDKYSGEAWKENRKKPIVYACCLSYACNLRCNYCYEEGLHDDSESMSLKDIDSMFSIIEHEQEKRGWIESKIILEGGEPFLLQNAELLKAFFEKTAEHIDGMRKRGSTCKLMIFSNGVNTLAYLELLKKYKNYIDCIQITIAGNRDTHDIYRKKPEGGSSFDNAVETIDKLLTENFPVLAVLNIDRGNIQCLPDIQELADEHEWTYDNKFKGMYVSRIKYLRKEDGNGLNEYELVQEIMEMYHKKLLRQNLLNFGDLRLLKNVINFCQSALNSGESISYHQFQGCIAGKQHQFIFGSCGYVYPCTKVTGRAEYSMGTYRPVFEPDEERLESWLCRNVLFIKKCEHCPVAFLCGGGCAYEAMEKNGSAYNPVCTETEKILRMYLDSMEEGMEFFLNDVVYENRPTFQQDIKLFNLIQKEI